MIWICILVGFIILVLWAMFSDPNGEKHKKFLDDIDKGNYEHYYKMYKENENLEYVNQYFAQFLGGFKDIGYCEDCHMVLFRDRLRLSLKCNAYDKTKIDINISDIKNVEMITEHHLVDKDNSKKNKSNTIKYGYVGAKALEKNEKELIGINLIKINVNYNNDNIELLFQVKHNEEYKLLEDIKKLIK